MAYATVYDMVLAFGERELIELTDHANAETMDEATVDRAIADAGQIVDSYLCQRYTLPLPQVPPIVRARACDMARWRLYKDRPSEEVRKRYEEAIAWLRDVVAGKAGLGFPESGEQPVASSGARTGAVASGYRWGAYP